MMQQDVVHADAFMRQFQAPEFTKCLSYFSGLYAPTIASGSSFKCIFILARIHT